MRIESKPENCVEPEYRGERTCIECYYAQVNDKHQWTGSERCWNAQCLVAGRESSQGERFKEER